MSMSKTLTLKNGSRIPGMFSSQEMTRRLQTLRNHLSENQIEAALFTSIHNINYFNEFIYCAFGRPYGLVVDHEQSTSVTANIDGGQPYRRGFGENLVFTDWQRDNFFVALQELMKNNKRIGIEFDHVSREVFQKLTQAFPEAEWFDIGQATMQMRLLKSAEEIELIRQGARIADLGGYACVEAIQPGVPEHEVALHATQTMVREIAKTYPNTELRDTWTWFQSGINTDGAHNPVTSRKIQKGDILSLNTFPMIAGYYTALERTLFCESATTREMELWEVNCEVYRRGLKLIQPGARCCDIALELNALYQAHDLLEYRTFGYGHSFGTLCHYYGREAGLELREDIETVLVPGMVVSMEPMIMIPQGMPGAGGYREHDILVVHEEKAENITGFPVGPAHNIVSAR